jgi:integrase/recombinase XerD
MTRHLLVDPDKLREQVRGKYREVAVDPGARFHFHAARIADPVTRRAAIARRVSPHTLRRTLITVSSRTTMGYDRARTSLDRHATCIVAAFIAGAAR